MAGAIQDNVSTKWPTICNRRRLAGLRSSLRRRRKLLSETGNSLPERAKINEAINNVLERLANELLKAGDYSNAYDLFFWLPDEGKYAKSRCQGLADCLLRLKYLEDAIVVAEYAIKIYPNDEDLRITYLNALYLSASYDKCLNVAYDSLVLFPTEVAFSFFIAQSHECLEQLDDAEERYRLILSENPEDALLHEGIARCLIGKGQPRKAVPLLRRAMHACPDPGCYYELVRAYTDLDQYDKALRVARKAFNLFSDADGLSYGYLGMALRNNGEYDEAIYVLSEGLLLYPEEDMISELFDDIE